MYLLIVLDMRKW